MNQRDLDLCSALNAGYLLRLSLLPDVKELDPCIGKEFYPELYEQKEKQIDNGPKGTKKGTKDVISTDQLLFDGRVLIFCRGYSKEIGTGRLLLPKLDYLQASLVQRSSTALTRKFGAVERQLEDFVFDIILKFNNAVEGAYRQIMQQFRDFTVNMLENFGLTKNELVAGLISKSANNTQSNMTSNGTDSKMQSKPGGSSLMYNIRGKKYSNLQGIAHPRRSSLTHLT